MKLVPRLLEPLLTVTIGLPLATNSFSADYPDKPITFVVPFPAGGATDATARAMALKMSEKLRQPIIIDNRPGVTGAIGAVFVKRSPADGYTLLASSLGTFVIAPHLQKNLAYDAGRDFDYISVSVQTPNVLVAGPTQTARTAGEVIELLKKEPGRVSFASSGSGASDHLAAELFWQQTKTQGLHVPYKGGAPAINDLLGGQVHFSFPNVNSALPFIKSGKLRAIAVTGNKRSPVLPDVPTLAEAGIEGAEVYSWQGIAAPRGIPAAVKGQLSKAAMEAVNDPDLKKRFLAQGLEIVGNTPEQFTAMQARESAAWKKLIETRQITAN